MIEVIFRDYDRGGDEELFRSEVPEAGLPGVGDTIVLRGEDTFTVNSRNVVFARADDLVYCSRIVYYLTSKGVSNGLQSMQERPAPGKA